jgi:hypothetical protein
MQSRLNNTVSSSDITIDNFINPEAFRKDRLTDSGGGILIYIRNTLLGRRRLDLEVPEVESVCLEIFADNRKFVFGGTMVTTEVWKYIAISNYIIIIDQYRIN